MDPSSPAKRRALAPLDANSNAISPRQQLHHKTIAPGSPTNYPTKSPLCLKRPLGAVIFDENSVVAKKKKKQCQEPVSAPAHEHEHVSAAPDIAFVPAPAPTFAPTPMSTPVSAQRRTDPDGKEGHTEQTIQEAQRPGAQNDKRQQISLRSASPDTPSVFDNSAVDTSQNTTVLTEPDLEQARTPTPPRLRTLLTREEARQKVEIIRLKLGLANYKLQTGQEAVPFNRLQMKPIFGLEQRALPRVTVQPPSSRDGPPEKETVAVKPGEKKEGEKEVHAGKAAPPVMSGQTAADDGSTTACSGVASSLLSLARASSSVSASS